MNKRKKALLIWIGLLAVLAAAGVFFSFILPKMTEDGDDGDTGIEYNYVDDYFYEKLWVPLESRDDYEDYLDLDRNIYVAKGSVTTTMTGDNDSYFTEDELFFKTYFEVLEAGDADAYNELLSDAYKAEYGLKGAFTPQMTYDRTIEHAGTSYAGTVTYYTFNVYYKFFHNDGTFRSDVYSDAERAMQIVIDTSEGKLKISSIQYYV